MLKVGVVGASGYAGAELLRLIKNHPGMEVTYVTAHTYAGQSVSSLYPAFLGVLDDKFEEFNLDKAKEKCEALFFSLPHGKSMEMIPGVLESGIKVVDLGADFRLGKPEVFEEWYGVEHSSPVILEGVVYGLTEFNREKVIAAEIVANPGCYPTGALLGLLPLVKGGLVGEGQVVVDSKSGASGAGRGLDLSLHFSQLDENLKPYSVSGHRHLPEIEQEVIKFGQEENIGICFVPHLVPMVRGILTTMYVPIKSGVGAKEIGEILALAYESEKFVTVMNSGSYPETKAVQGTNRCHVGYDLQESLEIAVVMTAIDNLGKGAAGQAIQNMNLMCGLEEDQGLKQTALFP